MFIRGQRVDRMNERSRDSRLYQDTLCDLPPHERARLALMLKPAIEGKAKEHQREGGGSGPSGRMKSSKPRTRKQVAEAAGVSRECQATHCFCSNAGIRGQDERRSGVLESGGVGGASLPCQTVT